MISTAPTMNSSDTIECCRLSHIRCFRFGQHLRLIYQREVERLNSFHPSLDFKAFITVNHNILCEKLNYYGLRGNVNRLIQSYLANRKQCFN